MAWPTIIFHIVKVINGADLRSGLRSRTYAEGGSVAIERLGTLEKPKIWGKDTKCKSGESVHDEVDPQQLNCAMYRILIIIGDSRNKGEDDSRDVDSYLELNGNKFLVLERVTMILPEGTF
jgi:hypothetical protein